MIKIQISQDSRMIKGLEVPDILHDDRCGRIYRSILSEVEKPLIEHVLRQTDGNQLKAARILGINRNTIRSKIKKLMIDVARWKQ